MSKGRVLLGMSGGVDSSVAASLLKEDGWDVVGVTMKVWPQDCMSRAEDKCCGPQAVADARSVAHALDIPHYVVDEAAEFEKVVIEYFGSEYRQGRTPNPCVMCNEKLKFGRLQDKALALGATHVATGHYAQIVHEGGRSRLFRAKDRKKDQSYFLFSLRDGQLGRSLSPLGHLEKPEVRAIAKKLGLKTYDKEESQEICFVPGNDYAAFLKGHFGAETFHPGGIHLRDGTRIGDHEGIEMYTVGQRKGLPGGQGKPLYVLDIDPKSQSVIVGGYEELERPDCFIDNTNWLTENGTLDGKREIEVKVRYNWPAVRAHVEPVEGHPHRGRVIFAEPQRAVSPGQAAVCYVRSSGDDFDEVLGGGWIERSEIVVGDPQAALAGKH